MPAVDYALFIEAGATLAVSFEWREDDGSNPPTGPLIDTDGYEPHMQLRDKPGGTILAEFNSECGLTVAGGIVALRIGADVSESLVPATKAVFDLELHNATDPSDVVRLVQGKVAISPDVTRTATP